MEEAVRALAASQHGVVTRGQLCAAGLSPQMVDRRLEARQLRRLHRGVYLYGPLVDRRTMDLAAVLTCGPTAVLSHWSAGTAWDAVPARAKDAPVDVTVSCGDPRHPGIRVHRVRTLHTDEVTKVDEIPVTTIARTLLDLAGSLPRHTLERAVGRALARDAATPRELKRLVVRHAGRAGSRRLRALLDSGQPAFTRSEAEDRFHALIRRAHLPMAEVNATVCNLEVDFFWRRKRLVVEIDGFRTTLRSARSRATGGATPCSQPRAYASCG